MKSFALVGSVFFEMAFGVISPAATPSLGAETHDDRPRPQVHVGTGPVMRGQTTVRDAFSQSRTSPPLDTLCNPSN